MGRNVRDVGIADARGYARDAAFHHLFDTAFFFIRRKHLRNRETPVVCKRITEVDKQEKMQRRVFLVLWVPI